MKFSACLSALLLFATQLNAGSNPDIILLAAPFNDQTVNAQIGAGGAAQGQPVSIASQLQAFVVPAGVLPTPSPASDAGRQWCGALRGLRLPQ
jgi:hypothetical protein